MTTHNSDNHPRIRFLLGYCAAMSTFFLGAFGASWLVCHVIMHLN